MRDVVVVGAGPGGSATAHFLAQRGLDVLLLDRFDFPREKTCGDGLTPRALRVLDRMGILSEVAQHGCPIDGYEVVAPNGGLTSASIQSSDGALAVPRRILDDLILRRALASGARFQPHTTVTHLEPSSASVTVYAHDGRRHEARAAVIATGAATGVLTKSRILRHHPQAMLAARAYFEDLPRPPGSAFQLRFDGVPLPGYGWIFPVGERTANVGVGYLPRRRGRSEPATRAVERFVGRLASLRGARQCGPIRGYPIRVDFLRSPTFAQRTLLVGEAAGLVNPLTGEGIDYALESGAIAAAHLADALGRTGVEHEHLDSYHQHLHQRFAKIFRFSEIVRDWYCIPPLLNVLVPLANRQPVLRQALADVVLGEREPAGYGPLSILARVALYLARRPIRR